MSTLQATNLKHGSSASNNLVLDANGNVTAAGTVAMATPFAMRNKIINGAMEIDQRNAGASVTPVDSSYTVDRWTFEVSQASKLTFQQNAGSVTPPTGFKNYAGITSSSAYSVTSSDQFWFHQRIEGSNIVDLAWGTSGAKTVTLSFWVRSSLTGTFGGSLTNSGVTRVYPFSYTISAANTWEQKIITVPGDTTGTWLTTTGIGIRLYFGIGSGSNFLGSTSAWGATDYRGGLTGATSVVGTNGATFYLTGVQLEVGSAATPFERRLYGTELQLAQRYFEKSYDQATAIGTGASVGRNSMYFANFNSNARSHIQFRVTKRGTPTVTIYRPSNGAAGSFDNSAGNAVACQINFAGDAGAELQSNGTADGYFLQWAATAEL